MTDRHIDIDEIDNARANTETNSTSGSADFVQSGPTGWEPRPGRRFEGMLRRMANRPHLSNPLNQVLPVEARRHFRASQREMLMGWRSIIDQAINRLNKEDAKDNIPPGERVDPNKIYIEDVDI
jgi:hypothetical protein